MMAATPFAMMIVNQEIRDEDLFSDNQTGRIIKIHRNSFMENFLVPPEMQTKSVGQKVKSVRFPLKSKELVTVRQIPRTTQEENEILWYSSHELDRIQEHDDSDCLRAISNKGCRGFLDNAFLATEGSNRQQINLNCWSRYATNLRGLELVVNKQHSVERYVQKSVSIHSILVAQAVGRSRMTEPSMAATLARISERSSRRARDFATALGAADEYAEVLAQRASMM